MQFVNDLQIGGQYPQLGRGAQFEFAAFVDIKRLVSVICLDPDFEPFCRFLEQGEAVTDIGGFFRRQQAFTEETNLTGKLGIGQLFEVAADLLLQRVVEGTSGRQVNMVEIIQREIEQLTKASSGHIARLVIVDAGDGGLFDKIAERQGLLKGGIPEANRDDPLLSQQPQMTVDQFFQLAAPLT